MPTATVRHTRRPPAKTAKAQAAPTGTPKPTRAPSTPKKAPKPAKPPTAKAASSRPSRTPTKKPARRSNTKAATASKPPVKAAKPPAKPTRFWRALGLSAAGVAAAAGLYAAYRKRGTLMAAVQPVLHRMTPAEKARFVKECNAKGVKGKTAKGVVKGVDKGRGKASDKAADPVPGRVAAVVTVLIALVLTVSYARMKTRGPMSRHTQRPGLHPADSAKRSTVRVRVRLERQIKEVPDYRRTHSEIRYPTSEEVNSQFKQDSKRRMWHFGNSGLPVVWSQRVHNQLDEWIITHNLNKVQIYCWCTQTLFADVLKTHLFNFYAPPEYSVGTVGGEEAHIYCTSDGELIIRFSMLLRKTENPEAPSTPRLDVCITISRQGVLGKFVVKQGL